MAAAPLSVGLPSFSGTGSFARFIADFETFAVLQGWEKDKKVALLPLCLTGIARDAYDAFPEQCKKDIDAACKRLTVAFPSGDKVEAQVQLRSLRFTADDSLDAFVVKLRGLVSRAFPGTEHDPLLYNYFLQSLPPTYQQTLIGEGIQTFDSAVTKVRNLSCAAKVAASSTQTVRQVAATDETDSLRQRVRELESKLSRLECSQASARPPPMATSGRTCFCCGLPGHNQASCRRRHLPCHLCGTVGHLARMCRERVNPQRAGTGPDPRPGQQRTPTPGFQRGPGSHQWGARPQDQRPPRTAQSAQPDLVRGPST